MEIYRDVGKGGGNGLGICWFLRKIAGTPGWRWDIMVPTSNDAFCREGVIFVPATPAAEGCGLPSKIVFINREECRNDQHYVRLRPRLHPGAERGPAACGAAGIWRGGVADHGGKAVGEKF